MFRLNFYYTKAFVALPAIGSRDMLSAGEREISQEGGGGRECWGGGAREVQWAWWKIMWKSSNPSGITARYVAIPPTSRTVLDQFPSSILAKR